MCAQVLPCLLASLSLYPGRIYTQLSQDRRTI
ncbi:unnamed protein product [Ectocarpus sp. CCAP 1310/34]|nr:unnamed protein product [Ectocarpus sp. CCAP 1310/34]